MTPSWRTVTSGLSCTSSGAGHVVVEPVEAAHVVRAVVAAVARAHAAVVDLPVQPLLACGTPRRPGTPARTARPRSAGRTSAGTCCAGWPAVPSCPALQAQPVLAAARRPPAALPTTGTLFSAWQATTHAWQPVQRVDVHRHAPAVARVLLPAGTCVGWLGALGGLPRSASLARGARGRRAGRSRDRPGRGSPAGSASGRRAPRLGQRHLHRRGTAGRRRPPRARRQQRHRVRRAGGGAATYCRRTW